MLARGIVAVLLVAVLLPRVSGASAHAALERSAPAAGARLATPPSQVELFFGEQLVQNRSGTFAVVYSDAGKQISGEGRIDTQDGRHLIVPLQGTLDAGIYIVFWKTTSDQDGGVTLGSFSFSVGQPATATSQSEPVAGQVLVPDDQRQRALAITVPQRSGGIGRWGAAAAGAAGGLIAGAALTVLATRRRPRHGEQISRQSPRNTRR